MCSPDVHTSRASHACGREHAVFAFDALRELRGSGYVSRVVNKNGNWEVRHGILIGSRGSVKLLVLVLLVDQIYSRKIN